MTPDMMKKLTVGDVYYHLGEPKDDEFELEYSWTIEEVDTGAARAQAQAAATAAASLQQQHQARAAAALVSSGFPPGHIGSAYPRVYPHQQVTHHIMPPPQQQRSHQFAQPQPRPQLQQHSHLHLRQQQPQQQQSARPVGMPAIGEGGATRYAVPWGAGQHQQQPASLGMGSTGLATVNAAAAARMLAPVSAHADVTGGEESQLAWSETPQQEQPTPQQQSPAQQQQLQQEQQALFHQQHQQHQQAPASKPGVMGPPSSVSVGVTKPQLQLQAPEGSAASVVAAAPVPTPSWQSGSRSTRLPENYDASVDQFSTMFGGHNANGGFIPLPGDETMNRTFDEMLQTGDMENFMNGPTTAVGNDGGVSAPASADPSTLLNNSRGIATDNDENTMESISTVASNGRTADPTPGTKRSLDGQNLSQQKKLKTSPEIDRHALHPSTEKKK